MDCGLTGKVALVTGGASGIGLAVSKALKVEGARVVIADRNGAAAAEEAAALGCAHQALDVADETAVEAVVAALEAEEGPIAVLVTCAGVLQRTLPPQELGWKEWDLIQQVHLRGTYACCRSVGSRMITRGGGSIVTISSVVGLTSAPVHSYGPAKAAIAQLSACLAGEWGPAGVRVNAVAPGFTATPALQRGFEAQALQESVLSRSAALGRLVQSDEIAKAVCFLASDLSSAIIGITLPVDAGFLVGVPWAAYGGLRGLDEI
ncbi:MAG: SDR family oxidoreductase [Pseudomonadota bacterium]